METYKRYFLIMALSTLLSLDILAQGNFLPFPKANDAFWKQQVPAEMRADYIALGEKEVNKPWNAIPQEIFAQYRTNGNRVSYEGESFGIRKQFVCLVMAEIMQGEGRFLPSIFQGIHYFIEKEPWWGIPAHYPKDHPEKQTQVVDLFNAETASMLAWTIYMMADEINKNEAGLVDSVKNEIEVRFLNPTLYNEQGWKHNANNWNTWITSNWLECLLICEQDAAKRAEAIRGIHQCLNLFLNGYPDDGGCEEGVSYWDRAAASFFESLYFMQYAEDAQMTLTDAQKAKVHAMGQFITTMHIHDLNFVNFSDAAPKCLPNINILFPYGAYVKDDAMMKFAAFIGDKYDFVHHPSALFLPSGNYPTLGRELMLLSMLPQYLQTPVEQPQTQDTYLANSQIMVARNATDSKSSWLVAVKGGNNNESHNHNDIGNVIVYHNDAPVVIDLGRDTYTAQTFSSRRYEMINNRSMNHNVPYINNKEQVAGKEYKAENVTHEATSDQSSLLLNIEKAYPPEAGVKEWTQTTTLDRKHDCVESKARFTLVNGTTPVEQILMCYGEPKMVKKGVIALQDGNVWLQYDKALLTPSWEKLKMNDGIMKEQWQDNVYRLVLTVTDKGRKQGQYSYRFTHSR